MRVAVEELPGVTGAEVSLEDGLVAVRLAETNEVTVNALREAIRDQGFTPRAADIVVSGELDAVDDRLVLRVPGTPSPYPIVGSGDALAGLRAAVGRTLRLPGHVPEHEGPGPPLIHVDGG